MNTEVNQNKMAKEDGITSKKSKNFSEWYTQIVVKGDLADYSPVKGCMIIKPSGYKIWENIQAYFNIILKKYNVKNAYFPLFIPESFFKKETEHAKGFQPEVAWIANKEDERLAVRPTSETIIYDTYSKWIRSWRDLPFRLNQWCNVVRWETKATKLFLRTREFLWQEGHCVYSTKEEADKEMLLILKEYQKLCHELLAIPVLAGKKTEKEKFAGALYTTSIEAFMPENKALQMGTSHNLGQGFAKSFNISYLGKDEKLHTPWQTSWGISTRLIGALAMMHGDDKGLVLPPRIAPIQIIIIPIFFDKDKKKVLKVANKIKDFLKDFSIEIDKREEYTPGWKFNEWELKGVPLRIEIGPKDVSKKQVVLVRRDTSEKQAIKIKDINKKVSNLLEDIQKNLFNKANQFLKESIVKVKTWKEFLKAVNNRKLIRAPFCGDISCEDSIKDKTNGVKSINIPFDSNPEGYCVNCGKKAAYEVYFAKSY